MKVIFYYLWWAIAHFHRWFSVRLFKINQLIFKHRGTPLESKELWLKDYNKGFLAFPDGILDQFAFGALALLVLCLEIGLIFIVKAQSYLLQYKWMFIAFFLLSMLWVYYDLYYRSREWLKQRINAQKKKFELKLED